jgi:hypothetical protein
MKRGDKTGARWLGALLALGLATGSVPARGQDSPDELARRHFESGAAYLQESDYDNALKAFEKAYDLSKRPEILLNIATVHERRSDLKQAVASLEKYLEVAPEGDQRGIVEARIANLQKRIEAEEKSAPADGGAPLPPVEPKPVSEKPAQPGRKTAEPATAPASNVPAYVLLGLGALAAGGAVVTGVLAKGEYDDAKDRCSPSCTNDDVSAGKTLALTSTILTGVAVVSASVGAVLLFTAEPAKEKTSERRLPTPHWSVGLAPLPHGAAASARFRF